MEKGMVISLFKHFFRGRFDFDFLFYIHIKHNSKNSILISCLLRRK